MIQFLLGYGVQNPPQRFPWCGSDCVAEASLVWQDTQAAAEEFYDRTDACTFTTFVGWEWSGQPGGNNLHRNVIFRNAVVPAMPTSYMEEPTPQGLWNVLRAQCLDGLPEGEHTAKVAKVLRPPVGEAYASVESPRGELGVYLVSDGTEHPYRMRYRPPALYALQAVFRAVDPERAEKAVNRERDWQFRQLMKRLT